MQLRRAARLVAYAAPATPQRAIKGPLSIMLQTTAPAAMTSAGRVSPMPLNPAEAVAAAESGNAPSAVARI